LHPILSVGYWLLVGVTYSYDGPENSPPIVLSVARGFLDEQLASLSSIKVGLGFIQGRREAASKVDVIRSEEFDEKAILSGFIL